MFTEITSQNEKAVGELSRILDELTVRWDELNLRHERLGGKYYLGMTDALLEAEGMVQKAIDRLTAEGSEP